jgi:hypothetical protein
VAGWSDGRVSASPWSPAKSACVTAPEATGSVSDQSLLELYKVAAQVIPVLWLGSALQQLNVGDRLRRLEDRHDVSEHQWGDYDEAVQEWLREAQTAAREEAGRQTSRWALGLVPIAAISEALALYGVAADCTVWWVTVAVVTGLVTGALLVLAPTWIAALQFRKDPRGDPR